MKLVEIVHQDDLPKTALEQLLNCQILAVHLSPKNNDQDSAPYTLYLCGDSKEVHVIDILPNTRNELFVKLQKIFHSNSKKLAFDWYQSGTILCGYGFEIFGQLFDVTLAAKILDYNKWNERCTHERISKEFIENDYAANNHQKKYNIQSRLAYNLYKIREIMVKNIVKNGLVDVAKIEFECIAATVVMHMAGLGINIKLMKEFGEEIEKEIKGLRDELATVIPCEVNLNSQKQVIAALNDLGIHVDKIGKKTLLPLAGDNPILHILLDYKRLDKMHKDYVCKFLSYTNRQDERIHPEYNQIGASTGRYSCCNPPVQQVPKNLNFRDKLTASRHCYIIRADYSQIELRVLAEISQDRVMKDVFKKGNDLHRLTASRLCQKNVEDVTPNERSSAKAVNFGIVYGMGAEGLVSYASTNYGMQLTLAEATHFKNIFFDTYKDLAVWYSNQLALRSNEARTLSGRRRIWSDSIAKSTEFINFPIQGTSADIIKLALGHLVKNLDGLDANIICTIHDEIVVEASENDTEKAAKILHDTMVWAGRYFLASIPIVVDVTLGSHWGNGTKMLC